MDFNNIKGFNKMATTDQECVAQRSLAEYAYECKLKYNQIEYTKEQWMKLYDDGEITLSTVYENLIVSIRNAHGIPTNKVSEDGRDLDNNGDVKIGVLKKDGDKRRFVISNVKNKIGTIYFVGWNWLLHSPVFFAIPHPSLHLYDSDLDLFPAQGIKIMVHPVTGERTGGKYNQFAFDTFEDMACTDY